MDPGETSPPRGYRIIVPWRSDHGRRQELWEAARAHWQAAFPALPIVEGDVPGELFNRAAAINAAAAGDWDVGVILDADVVAAPEQVAQAIDVARSTGRLTLAFDLYLGLNKPTTDRYLEGRREHLERGVRFRSKVHESSIVVVPRALFDALGGFDTRFDSGWGQEDVSFCHAARVIGGGVERVSGNVWHLFHDKSAAKVRAQGRGGNVEAKALGDRYRQITEPDAMRALLAERHARVAG